MATPITEHTIPDIIRYAEQAQVITQLKISQQTFFKGGALSPDYSRTLYMVRSGVAFLYNSTPNYSTLRQSAEYLFALCRPFGPLPPPPATISITNPANQSTLVGGSVTFCVTVTVSTGAPYTIQWFKNGVLIPGATSPCYTQTNAQLTDNGATYNAIAMTAGLSQAVSATATITVTAALNGFFAYMSTDPFPTLQGHTDPFSYQVTFPVVNTGELDITMPSASSPNQYLIVKVPTSVNIFNTWKNGVFDGGTLGLTGDFDWQGYLQFGGFTYYSSRQALSFDTTKVLQFIP